MTYKYTRKLIIATALLSIMSCGGDKAPAAAPAVDSAKYAQNSCKELVGMITEAKTKVAGLDQARTELDKQKQTAMAVGMLLSPIGGALIGSDAEKQIKANLTERNAIAAEVTAMGSAGQAKKCWN